MRYDVIAKYDEGEEFRIDYVSNSELERVKGRLKVLHPQAEIKVVPLIGEGFEERAEE